MIEKCNHRVWQGKISQWRDIKALWLGCCIRSCLAKEYVCPGLQAA